jgi:hypothetical protein
VDPTKNGGVSKRRSVKRVITPIPLSSPDNQNEAYLKIGISNATVTNKFLCIYFFNAQRNTNTLKHTACHFKMNIMQRTLLNKRLLFMPWPINAINCSNYAKERQAVPHVVG